VKARAETLPRVFDRYREEFEAEERAVFRGRDLPFYDMLRYHLGWVDAQGNPLPQDGGKALRPTLCLLACEAAGGDYRKALPAAVALELVHNFSLIHDDIQDGDKERRHRPTVWAIWGSNQALNAGDSMHALSTLALGKLEGRGVPLERQLEAVRLLTEACLTMIEGQYLDIVYEERLDISVEDYLDMVGRKTGALLRCSCELGALLASDDRPVIQHLARFGYYLGLAFQVKDDILGIWGQSVTGKPVASDIRRRKKSLPVVYALSTRDPQLLRAYGERGAGHSLAPDEIELVMSRLEELGAMEWAQNKAEEFRRLAVTEVEGQPLKPSAKDDLLEMAAFLTQRSY
jgi:geranylgeranyl diphosphate synthase type I